MADDAEAQVASEERFWKNLEDSLSTECATHEAIDDALRTWLALVASCRDTYLLAEDDIASCSQMLLDSPVNAANQDYVRVQIIYSLLQEDEVNSLNAIANFLLLDGRTDDATFKQMIDEDCFPRIIELIQGQSSLDTRLHRLLLDLMYEMSRIDRLRTADLLCIDDGFIVDMFRVIEGLSDDVDDPYHYPNIRVLLMLNEQYMVASTTAAIDLDFDSSSTPLTNRVVKVLGAHGAIYKTFGENVILLLNRETETSLQLLILKLLYLLFTTPTTYEYFYTNDLRVLLDVIIRNLLDLPDDAVSLRHTYLRVVYPLLTHTQLRQPPHYKKDEILKVLRILSGHGNLHFEPADATTIRLIERISKVEWLNESGEMAVARKLLGISMSQSQSASSVSVVDVAAVMEKPGVQTPSRKLDVEAILENETLTPIPARLLPAVPRHRHGTLTPQGFVSTGKAGKKSTTTVGTAGDATRKLPPKTPPPRRTPRSKVTGLPPVIPSETSAHDGEC